MNMYSMIDDSPTRVFATSESLTGGAFTAVALGESGVANATAASVAPIGILAAETELPVAAGEDVNVVVSGGCLWTVGEAVKAGDMLTAGEGGKAFKATSGNFMFAQALENAASLEAARVLITRGGKA